MPEGLLLERDTFAIAQMEGKPIVRRLHIDHQCATIEFFVGLAAFQFIEIFLIYMLLFPLADRRILSVVFYLLIPLIDNGREKLSELDIDRRLLTDDLL